ncbi:hypothetical protein [uncultured Alistipes sp.]|jgi:membrane protein|uniref:hypothetical protein n=1 Tax=uncultured Alistipes sp. TaxID=538949 RepID=UPI0026011780|nr:hypothetical protein [uncultured Alistipes sp.]
MKQQDTDAQAKIDLIVKSINDSRKQLSPEYGGVILRIGYPLFLANLAIAIFHSRLSETGAAWIVLGAMVLTLATGWKLFRIFNMGVDTNKYGMQPLLLKIWSGLIVVIFCSVVSALLGVPDSLQTGAMTGYMVAITTASGLCTYLTGGIFQSKTIQGLALACLITAVGLARQNMGSDTLGHTYYVYTVTSFFALVLPGHILFYKAKKR